MSTHGNITHATADRSLEASLDYTPQSLKFGTSGRRGEVVHLTQLEIYINATAELEYLQSLPLTEGGIQKGEPFYFAYDLRPSSMRFVTEPQGRGEIAQAIEQAIADAGMTPINLGPLPTPALTSFALGKKCGSMMITGSHIPFDRNGYKTNSSAGELLKKDEPPIGARVEQVRHRLYAQSSDQSLFDSHGSLKGGSRKLSQVNEDAHRAYLQRYRDFFSGQTLAGKKLLVYQHSSVGRDLLVEMLRAFDARVICAGRSETFVPIDTEAINEAELTIIQALTDQAWKDHGPLDAVVSTDGDSDRPLILGVDKTGQVRFFGGDLVGMVVAEYLHADAAVVPISCNDAIDRGALRKIVQPKTRIGSPFVITAMAEARQHGSKAICGWEANGGFLTGSDISRNGKVLRALPTRDAMLPILATLFSAAEQNLSLGDLFDRLPKRYSKAALLRRFPRATSLKIIERFSPPNPKVTDAFFDGMRIKLSDSAAQSMVDETAAGSLQKIRAELGKYFTTAQGFGFINRLNYTDGVRIYFNNGDVAHVRPSGNADELRIYAVADIQARADEITTLGTAEPDGILRQLAGMVES